MLKNTYKFELIIEIDGRDIEAYMNDQPKSPNIKTAIAEITNTMYLGLSCIDGMLAKQFDITNTDSYVHSITYEDGNEH